MRHKVKGKAIESPDIQQQREPYILEHVREHVAVFHGLATSLPEVGHHRVARVSDEHRVSVGPALRQLITSTSHTHMS